MIIPVAQQIQQPSPNQKIDIVRPLQPDDLQISEVTCKLNSNSIIMGGDIKHNRYSRLSIKESINNKEELEYIYAEDRVLSGKGSQLGSHRDPVSHAISSKYDLRPRSIFNLLRVRRLAMKFISKLIHQAYLLKDMHLNNQQLSNIQRLLDGKFTQNKRVGDSSVPVFDTQSSFTLMWDLITIGLTLVSFIWSPLKVAFKVGGMEILEIVIICMIALDMGVSINRTKIQRGQAIVDRFQIWKIYLGEHVISDMLALLSLIAGYIFLHKNTEAFIIVTVIYYIVRIPRLQETIENLIEFYNVRGSMLEVLALVKMVSSVILIAHVLACAWHGVAYYSDEPITWLKFYDVFDVGTWQRYNVSFYWAAMTMTTVGYGDITPKNQRELVVANIVMFVSCIVFAYTMNSIGVLLNNIQKRKAEFKKKMTVINSYLHRHKVKYELQSRIRSYLEYKWREESDFNDQEVSTIVSTLSNSLQEELKFHLKGSTLLRCAIFDQFSKELLKKATQLIEEVRFAPEETIMSPTLQDDSSIFIINRGEVAIQSNPPTVIRSQTIGEASFFTNQPRSIALISKGFSTLLKLKRQDFMNMILQSQQDKEMFCFIKDSLIFHKTHRPLGVQCLCCSEYTHTSPQCPYLHFIPDRERVLKKYIYPHKQIRVKIIRVNHSRYRARLEVVQLQHQITQFMHDFVDEQASVEDPSGSNLPYEDMPPNNSGQSLTRLSAGGRSQRGFSVNNPMDGLSQTDHEHLEIRDPEDDEFNQNFRKSNEAKLTFATAGFAQLGQQSLRESSHHQIRESSHNQMHIIKENTSSSSSSSEVPKGRYIPLRAIDLPALPVRKRSPKLTFNQPFEELDEQLRHINQRQNSLGNNTIRTSQHRQGSIKTPRQGSSRSLTYTPIHSNYSNSQNVSYKSFINNISSGASNNQKGVNNNPSLYSLPPSPDELILNRKAQRQISSHSKTNTKMSKTSILPSNFAPFSGLENPLYVNEGQSLRDFEKFCEYNVYFPHNNLSIVIKRLNKTTKQSVKIRLSAYGYDYLGMRRAEKIRRVWDQ